MAKKKSDYLRMMELGEWLEAIFRQDIKPWQYEELFRGAKKLIGIIEIKKADTDTERNIDVTVSTLMYIAENNREQYYEQLADFHLLDSIVPINKDQLEIAPTFEEMVESIEESLRDTNIESDSKTPFPLRTVSTVFDKNHDDLKLKSFILKQISQKASRRNEEWIFVLTAVLEFYGFRKIANRWLGDIIEDKKPLHLNFKSLYFYEKLISNYNYMQHSLQYHKDEGFRDYFNVTGLFDDLGSEHVEVIFCRIFIDFLLLGGLDYYGFCQNCGNFFLVQRKGRKKFCSDACRVEHFREQH